MDHQAKVGIDMRDDSLKRKVAFLYVKRQMREEMVLAWEDFFEKNPGQKEEDLWRQVEERLRSKKDLEDQDKGVCDLKETQEVATQCEADYLLSEGSIATGEIAASVKSILLEKGFNANGSTEGDALRRREKIAPLILKRRIWWEHVPGASSYVVYVSKDRTIFEPVSFSWETTPGIISKLVIGETELVIPDEWPEFPTESGTYYIGITSRDDIGNQSAPLLLSGLFKFLAPSAPLRGGIEYL
jgi:hypothetical protein